MKIAYFVDYFIKFTEHNIQFSIGNAQKENIGYYYKKNLYFVVLLINHGNNKSVGYT